MLTLLVNKRLSWGLAGSKDPKSRNNSKLTWTFGKLISASRPLLRQVYAVRVSRKSDNERQSKTTFRQGAIAQLSGAPWQRQDPHHYMWAIIWMQTTIR